MCSIVGALVRRIDTHQKIQAVNDILEHIWQTSHERGRDGRGFVINSSAESELLAYREVTRSHGCAARAPALHKVCRSAAVVGNLRAEPTTEFVREKRLSDQQPYTSGAWSIVHNGTIANDKGLRTHDLPTSIDSAAIIGTASIAYIPNGKIVGLSKLSRLADMFARRLQVQERLTDQIADALFQNLEPKGVGVLIKARHLCMESRGDLSAGSPHCDHSSSRRYQGRA